MKHWMLMAAALSTGCLAQEGLADEQFDAAPRAAGAPETVPLSQTPKKSRPVKKPAVKTSSAAMAPAVPPAKGDVAIPRQDGVNVRGRTSVNAELVARLKKDDKVKVLDEVNLKNPKPDEPSKWLKVSLPSNAGVWVNTAFIDANSKAVIPSRLNLRGGPSENYPVVGRIPKGTVVKPLDTKGEWTKIEAPDEAFGFVAAHLLTKAPEAPQPPVLAATETPKPPVTPAPAPTPAPVTETTVPPSTPPPAIPTEPVKPAPEVAVAPPAPIVPPPVATPPAPTPEPPAPAVTATTPPSTLPAAPSELIKPEEPAEEEDVKRIVTREGIVRRSVSIQAPSYFVLENLNGKPIDYLHSSSTNVSLKNFFGKHIIVTGEELLDERWPNMPVINVETLEQIEEPPTPAPATTDGNN